MLESYASLIFEIIVRFLGVERATKSSKFGPVPENFIMTNVGCRGNEPTIQNCSHTEGGDCNGHNGAGVVSMDTLGKWHEIFQYFPYIN